jgi:hypothetical protein
LFPPKRKKESLNWPLHSNSDRAADTQTISSELADHGINICLRKPIGTTHSIMAAGFYNPILWTLKSLPSILKMHRPENKNAILNAPIADKSLPLFFSLFASHIKIAGERLATEDD